MKRTIRVRALSAAALAAGAIAVATSVEAQTTVIDLAEVGTARPGIRLDGIDNYDAASIASGAGDFNGDGLADVIVGAPGAAPGDTRFGHGESYIVFGRPDSATLNAGSLGPAGHRLIGIDLGDRTGTSVSGAGDLNGDGLADVVVGAVDASPGGVTKAGRSYVVFGRIGTSPIDLGALGAGGFLIDGSEFAEYSARRVSGAGDVNGDGLADLIIGARGADAGGRINAGKAYVVFGKADSSPIGLASLGSGGFAIDGAYTGGGMGWSASGAGDVNGDGLADVIVGSFQSDPDGNSAAYVVFGKTDGATVDLESLGSAGIRIGASPEDGINPSAVSGVGDANGDGLADVAIGAHLADPGGVENAGTCYVVFGREAPGEIELSELGDGGFRVDGQGETDWLGLSVAGAGDANGDGLADILVGAPYGGAGAEGECYVLFGKSDGHPISLPNLGNAGLRLDGADVRDAAGASVSAGGDVNGDGTADFLVGSHGDSTAPTGLHQRGESYVVFNPLAPSASAATYRATARSGNAPRVAVGISGDGSDDDSPSSRCWVDFDGGAGPGLAGSSMQTVTLTRNDAGIRILKPDRLANVQWRVETNRTGWRKTRVTLKYTDAEIAGLREDTLRVWRASSPRGPWQSYSYGMVREPQRNRISVNVPALGCFVIEGEPAP